MEFNNIFELNKGLEIILKEIVEVVAKKVEAKVKEHIDSDVYSFSGSQYYNSTGNRTGEFKDSWTASDAKPIPGGYQAEIASDPSRMQFNAETFLHGSYAGDVREYLGEIINDGLAGSLFGDGFWRSKRPFFDNTVQELMDGGLIRQWFIEEFRRRGIEVK